MKIFINPDEVLRYLGYKGQQIDNITKGLIEECIEEIAQNFNGKYIYRVFDIRKESDKVEAVGSRLKLFGKDIFAHLIDCTRCVIMAATLGIDIDNKIRYYEKSGLTKSVIFDACATTAIENFCDQVEQEIKDLAGKENLDITRRFSPGYGDLPIYIQGDILDVLDAYRKIGLSATENHILIPRKSVTAIIGFKKAGMLTTNHNCTQCNLNKDCDFKKGGNDCEH